MCDYSLMEVQNRLANEGEDLVVHRFPRGSMGLAPCQLQVVEDKTKSARGFWSSIKEFFKDPEPEPVVAVCIPPGARLLVGNIPEDLQRTYNAGPTEEVTFTQLTAEANRYRDAIRLKSGAEILLQQLREGQRVHVLQLALSDDPVAPEAAHAHRSAAPNS